MKWPCLAEKNYCMVAQPPVTCRFVRLDNDPPVFLLCDTIWPRVKSPGSDSDPIFEIVFVALFKNKDNLSFRKWNLASSLSPAGGRKVIRRFESLDVGDRVRVELIGADVERGFIDFARQGEGRGGLLPHRKMLPEGSLKRRG